MDTALALADWDGFAARRAEARRRGKLRGIGIANYVEITSGAPRERTEITVLPEGRVELVMGTMSSGQGHETSFAQLVTEWLGVPFDSIVYVAHDTARVTGWRRLPFRPLDEAGDHDHRQGDRRHHRQGPQDRRAFCSKPAKSTSSSSTAATGSPAPIARSASSRSPRPPSTRKDLPAELQGPLAGISDQTLPVASFPYGTQVCEVEVDAETGEVEIVGYAAVDDVGRAINPLILHGQTHGGIAQGVGQALLEHSHYDPETGQLLAASFMDYAMPRADTFAVLGHRAQRSAGADQPARRALRRRGRHHAGAGRGDQRDRRCAGRTRRAPHRNAGDARAGVARHSGSTLGRGRMIAIHEGPGWRARCSRNRSRGEVVVDFPSRSLNFCRQAYLAPDDRDSSSCSYAIKPVRAFGEAVFQVIAQKPGRLAEVSGSAQSGRNGSSPVRPSRR